jgi:glutathione S-transferase
LGCGLRIWRIPFSTNVERVALALGHKGIAVEWIDVDSSDRSEVERVSGQPLVPVLDDGGTILADSPVILDHLERRFPDPPLYSREPSREAEVRVFVDWFNRVWKRPPNLIAAELEKPQPDRDEIARLGARMRESLDLFEVLLDARNYLYGEFGMADCIAFPFLKYARGLPPGDDELFHEVLLEHQPLAGHPRLEAWIARVDEHPRA